MPIDTTKLTIAQAHEILSSGGVTPAEFLQAFKNTIKEKNESIFAFLEVFEESIPRFNENSLLSCIPISIKDNILIKGHTASASSKMLENFIAPYSASVIEQLHEAGAYMIGRTNMDEFAMGSSTETSAYGKTKNPIDISRVPGGSSGGAAASVVMGGALAAIGSDTAGSVRQPAGFCGLVGLYPTYGSVSRYGLIAMGSSLDQVGVMAKTVEDTEIVFNTISGYDVRDGNSLSVETRLHLASRPQKKRIGIPYDIINAEGIAPDVKKNFEESIEKMKHAGYEIIPISLPHIHHSLAVYYILMPAEVSSNLARFDGLRYGKVAEDKGSDLFHAYLESRETGFGPEVKRRILLGSYILSSGHYDSYYGLAQHVRALIAEDYKKAFELVDVIATPTSPTTAFKFGEKQDPIAMYMSDIFTVPANLAGTPAIAIPSGTDVNNLPYSMHFVAPHGCEQYLFDIGKEFETVVQSK